jgi:predicted dehydrogenase
LKRVNVAVIGCGFISQTAHIPNLLMIPEARLVSVADVEPSNLNQVSTKFGISEKFVDYHDVLKRDDVEVVIICTPTSTHDQIAIDAAEAGKHIFCEKPIASNSARADLMIKAARKNGVKLMIGHFSRFLPNHITAKKFIDKGEIGNILRVEGYSETLTIKPEEGVLLDYGVHLIDLVCWYLNYSKIDTVAGLLHSSTLDSPNTEASLMMKFNNGIIGKVDTFWMSDWQSWSAAERFVKILGSKGKIISDLTGPSLSLYKDGTLLGRFRGLHKIMPREAVNPKLPLTHIGYRKELEHFIECIIDDKEPSVSGYQGKMVIKIVEAAVTSNTEKKYVEVED